jgi:hypothetical protein
LKGGKGVGGWIGETKKVLYVIKSIDTSFLTAETATVHATDMYLECLDLTITYMQTINIASEHTEKPNVVSVSGSKLVRFDAKQPPAKWQSFASVLTVKAVIQ